MKHVKPVAALALCGLVFGAGAVVGQQMQKPMSGEDFDNVRWAYQNKGNAETSSTLADAYRDAPSNPLVVKRIMQTSLTDEASSRSLLLLQTAQNQKLIEQNKAMMEQNARIIALLEQQQKGK